MGPTEQAVAVTVLCGDVTRRRHAFDPTASRVYGRRWRPRRTSSSSASSNSDIVPACHTHARDSRTTASDCSCSWLLAASTREEPSRVEPGERACVTSLHLDRERILAARRPFKSTASPGIMHRINIPCLTSEKERSQLGAKEGIERDKGGEVAHDVDQDASLKQVYASFAQ
ncbi:hypothetical protein EAG_15569 [Camponotus floridanus]|uniref:Uncharacterized protein n=1 Tax=Camponotus floridanus TaxID=104421 RepID=E2AIY2_CAMFO|nr:hypothetical protein EAG_15569 [Camponotus floridanus]